MWVWLRQTKVDYTATDLELLEPTLHHLPLGEMELESEDTSLVKKAPSYRSVLTKRYRNTRKCVSSKAALLILMWSFPVTLLYGLASNPNINFIFVFNNKIPYLGLYGFTALIWCFFPLAGFLSDVKYGRYKTIVFSLVAILIGLCLPFLFPYVLIGYVGFTANVIQFGMDQLHDSPGEDRTLFIHWYVWFYFTSIFIGRSSAFIVYASEMLLGLLITYISIYVSVIVLLIISLCLGYFKKKHFLIEPGRVNPYQLVYRVTKFALQHRIPIQRSAFTYCEEELPSGLNLGKDKYGGPFTTEEVEDVKAFYGILKVLLSFGPVFLLDVAANLLRVWYSVVSKYGSFTTTVRDYLTYDELSLALIVICIPLYLFFLRPFVSRYIPGMLKRMGMGMFIITISLVFIFFASIVPDLALHPDGATQLGICYYNATNPPAITSLTYITVLTQNILSALSNMLIYIAAFEFICSQSPTSMIGLFIGLFYAIKGLFQLIATILLLLFWRCFYRNWFIYFLVNIIIGVVSIIVYVCVARRYEYRKRDEPCNVHKYAEDYFSNIQEEKHD